MNAKRTIIPGKVYYLDSFLISKTTLGWSVEAVGKQHPKFVSSSNTFRTWLSDKRLEPGATPDMVANYVSHSLGVKRIKIAFDGFQLVADYRSSNLPKVKLTEINDIISGKFGKGWTYTNPDAQKEAREILNSLLTKE